MALGTIVQGALKQLNVCHPAKPGEGRELGSVPNRWNRVGSMRGKPGCRPGSLFVQRLHEIHPQVSSPSPRPKAGKSLSLSSFCPQGLSIAGAFHSFLLLQLSPGCMHPHPDQTPPAPRIVSQLPASPPLGTNTLHLLSTNQSQGRHTAQ